MLTVREELTKTFMQEKFVPTIKELFKTKSPEKYKQWGENCCVQIAVFGTFFLSKMLMDYTFTVYEGIFHDKVKGRDVKYNHAWIYAVSSDKSRKLFIDMGRSMQENIFIEQDKNAYDNKIFGYEDIKEVKRTQLDWRRMLATETEYYTGLPSMEVAHLLENSF